MEIRFPGGQRVDALHEGFWIRTDQPVAQGGSGEAPSPFELLLASIGACAGFYALRFCQQRELDTDGLAVRLTTETDAARKGVSRVRIEIGLPRGFPEKYCDAIIRAIDQCTVKRHILDPPVFEVMTTPAEVPVGVAG